MARLGATKDGAEALHETVDPYPTEVAHAASTLSERNRHNTPQNRVVIAFLLYDGMTGLDLHGPWEAISVAARMSGGDVTRHLVAATRDHVTTDAGMLLQPTATLADVPAPDILIVPGTGTPHVPMSDRRITDWVRTADRTSTYTASVCTGALVLGMAGLLRGRRATTHWAFRDYLRWAGASAMEDRWVQDGKLLTSAGISAGIDLALVLVDKLWGRDVVARTQAVMQYEPQPPFDFGSGDKLPPQVLHQMQQGMTYEQQLIRSALTSAHAN